MFLSKYEDKQNYTFMLVFNMTLEFIAITFIYEYDIKENKFWEAKLELL